MVALPLDDEPRVQAFFEANPGYFHTCNGEPLTPGEALEKLKGELPEGWEYDRRWIWGYVDRHGDLAALVTVISDLWAPAVWHIAFFIVASSRHGTGEAELIHAEIERWAQQHGAQWMRLAVVQGNHKAERFWAKLGYQQTRTREGIEMGKRINTVRMMIRPLAGRTVQEHLQRVPRDRPEVGVSGFQG
ncbi:GNAT family N-acetyltransferase [Pseudomonas huanghezhanensis]|uniref:GNAT family N-acetyltransferase n=1 Tax=Pseudomonas huanghezhanensis TaxID=3002903 RepID=UPI0022859445|nr:GNAT family N-acetyltransferase [Pseudomonas sp. BSw22131]